MMSYMDGMGFTTAQQGAPYVNSYAPSAPAGVNGTVQMSAGVGGGGGQQAGAIGLLVILGGLVVFYVATRRIQGGR